MKTTDPDYDKKVQKFLNSIRTIDENKCPADCDVCRFDIDQDEFTQLMALNLDKNPE